MTGAFRSATINDAAILYAWRLADQGFWYQGDPLDYQEHLDWLEARLGNPLVRLLIWEEDGGPTGMVRVDSNGELAFHGSSVEMLRQAHTLAADYGGRLKASVDQADHQKIRLLQRAGFELFPVKFLCYRP